MTLTERALVLCCGAWWVTERLREEDVWDSTACAMDMRLGPTPGHWRQKAEHIALRRERTRLRCALAAAGLRIGALEWAAKRAAAELRHAYAVQHPSHWRLVGRAVEVLEGATTPRDHSRCPDNPCPGFFPYCEGLDP